MWWLWNLGKRYTDHGDADCHHHHHLPHIFWCDSRRLLSRSEWPSRSPPEPSFHSAPSSHSWASLCDLQIHPWFAVRHGDGKDWAFPASATHLPGWQLTDVLLSLTLLNRPSHLPDDRKRGLIIAVSFFFCAGHTFTQSGPICTVCNGDIQSVFMCHFVLFLPTNILIIPPDPQHTLLIERGNQHINLTKLLETALNYCSKQLRTLALIVSHVSGCYSHAVLLWFVQQEILVSLSVFLSACCLAGRQRTFC